ncbi:MAG: dTDP-glucose 4,6-dehydratase [Alteromonadaceae bacterium]|nr:MAG: dTDP-glucose 4,6-dehydratase [Alteromonadaceae bacterium]
MSKVLLVTGAAGFIGANFVLYWMEKYPEDKVIALDALTYAGNRANLAAVEDNTNFTFAHVNILDEPVIEALLKDHNVDTIVHFAAESHVDRSITEPDAFLETNIIGTHSLLKAARQVWIEKGLHPSDHRFHHVSTDEVYGTLSPTDPAFSETTPYAPNSPYAASKAASDHLVRSYHHTYGLQVSTSNCSNNYGPYHFPEKLIPLVITNILFNKALPIYGDGQQIRDWLYVEDHARGIDLVLEKGVVGETYNIGGINEWANIDIVKLICKLVDEYFANETELVQRFAKATAAIAGQSESLITYVKDRPGHDRRYAIDPTKANDILGYQPQESFETGIRKTIAWYLNNEQWWQAVMDGSYQDWVSKQYGQS